jgi:hypothetical protein
MYTSLHMYLPVLGHGWVFLFSNKETMGKGQIHGSLTHASQKIKEWVLTICHTSLKNGGTGPRTLLKILKNLEPDVKRKE